MTEDLLGPLAEHVEPELVTPLVVYLCSEANQFTHQIFTAGGGRYARVFIGTNPGWFAGKGVVPSVEDIAANMDAIRDISDYIIPESNTDEIILLGQKLAE